jgi:hypothetical protein
MGACAPGPVYQGLCATSPVRRGPAAGEVCHRSCRTGAAGVCGARAPTDPLSAVPGAACTPVPPPPSAPPARQPAPGGPVCAEDSGLTETLVDSRPPKSPLSPKFPRSFRTTGSAGPWPPVPRVPLATGAARAPGPASVCAARATGDQRSIVASMVRLRAQLARPRTCGPGCHGPAPEGGCVRHVNRVVAATMSSGARRCGNDVVGAGPAVSWSVPRGPASPPITWSA